MFVSLWLFITACASRSVHISPRGTWAVINLCESLGYVDITCVMSVSKSPIPVIVGYVFVGLKIGNSILITCGLLHVYEQTGGVIHC